MRKPALLTALMLSPKPWRPTGEFVEGVLIRYTITSE